MKLSERINQLAAILESHGDIELVEFNGFDYSRNLRAPCISKVVPADSMTNYETYYQDSELDLFRRAASTRPSDEVIDSGWNNLSSELQGVWGSKDAYVARMTHSSNRAARIIEAWPKLETVLVI